MNLTALILAPAVLLGAAAATPARACDCDKGHAMPTAAVQPDRKLASPQSAATKNARTLQIAVTSDGFAPAEVTVKRGQPVKLVVTRKVERTCATEIVMKDFGVHQPLPLNQPVTVTLTPKEPGEYRFACGMDMIAGVLKVE